MEKTIVKVENTQLMGVQVRTSYEKEMNPLTSEIAPCVQRYWQLGLADKLVGRINPGRLIAAYFDYETDHTGVYSYFLGEEVEFAASPPEGLSVLTLPGGSFARFTTLPAPIPHVIMDAWYNIWQMDASVLSGERKYQVDFEVYDERAINPMAAIVDVYVGIATLG